MRSVFACLAVVLAAAPGCSSKDDNTETSSSGNTENSTGGQSPTGMNGTGGANVTDGVSTDGGEGAPPIALDECGLDTGYEGDEFCILPPPPDKGFQLHIGPADYDNPDTAYVLLPGDEFTTDFPAVSGNQEDVFFYYRQYRMRPSAHHAIVTVEDGSTILGRRIATANMSQDFPAGGVIPPENQGVGIPLAPSSNLNVSFHTINTRETPQLREIWVNFWYRDPAEVTEPAEQLFKIGSMSFAIAPQSSATLGPYSCSIPNQGRLLWLYGHRHANNVRFTAWRVRGEQRDVIYDANRWEEPLLLEYSSNVENPAPDIENGIEGGWSGILDLMPGDQLEWQCEVVNQNDTTLYFSNQTYLGEMCIVDGELVGTTCSGI